MFARYTITDYTLDKMKSCPDSYQAMIDFGEKIKVRQYKNFNSIIENIKSSLPKGEGILNMGDIEGKLFPSPDNSPRVFISHSHFNENHVLFLVGFLSLMSIECFVDSWQWGYIDKIQLMLDEEYSKIDEYIYSYEKVIHTTSIVKPLLISAITKVIDKTECAIFLHTEDSTLSVDNHPLGTSSPWLYLENIAMGILRPKIPSYLEKKMKYYSKEGRFLAGDSKIIEYFPLSYEFPELGISSIRNLTKYKNAEDALTHLYQSVPEGWNENFPNRYIVK